MVTHVLFRPLVEHVLILYYAILGIMFLSTLYVVQYIYLRYYAYRARKAAKLAIAKGVKPSEIMAQRLQMGTDNLQGLEPEALPKTDVDLKSIEKELKRRTKKGKW